MQFLQAAMTAAVTSPSAPLRRFQCSAARFRVPGKEHLMHVRRQIKAVDDRSPREETEQSAYRSMNCGKSFDMVIPAVVTHSMKRATRMARFPDTTPNHAANSGGARIAALEAVFGRERLAAGLSAFWEGRADAGGSVSASSASQFYLRHCFGIQGVLNFEEYFRIWAGGFYEARMDRESAHAVLIVFLYENFSALRDLFILDRRENRTVAPDAEAVWRCLEAPENAVLFEGDDFAEWVMQQWLPFHLRSVYPEGGDMPAPALEAGADCVQE
jgi:hypothetical protein